MRGLLLLPLALAVPACGGAASAQAVVAGRPAASAATCRAADLRAVFRGFHPAGGSLTGAVVLTDVGAEPCRLAGTPPSVTLLDESGTPVGVKSHALAVPAGAGAVQLAPGTPLPAFGAPPSRGLAWFVVTWSNWCSEALPAVQSLLIVLPAGGSVAAPQDAAISTLLAGPSAPRCADARAGSTLTIGRFQAPGAQPAAA